MITSEEFFDQAKQRDRAEVIKSLRERKDAARDEYRSSREQYDAYVEHHQPPPYASLDNWSVAQLPIEELAQRSEALNWETSWLDLAILKYVNDAWDRGETAPWFTEGYRSVACPDPLILNDPHPSVRELEARRRKLWVEYLDLVSALEALTDVGLIDISYEARVNGQCGTAHDLLVKRQVEVSRAHEVARKDVVREVRIHFARLTFKTQDEDGRTRYVLVDELDTKRVEYVEWPKP